MPSEPRNGNRGILRKCAMEHTSPNLDYAQAVLSCFVIPQDVHGGMGGGFALKLERCTDRWAVS